MLQHYNNQICSRQERSSGGPGGQVPLQKQNKQGRFNSFFKDFTVDDT